MKCVRVCIYIHTHTDTIFLLTLIHKTWVRAVLRIASRFNANAMQDSI
jgi:hypothetical protein